MSRTYKIIVLICLSFSLLLLGDAAITQQRISQLIGVAGFSNLILVIATCGLVVSLLTIGQLVKMPIERQPEKSLSTPIIAEMKMPGENHLPDTDQDALNIIVLDDASRASEHKTPPPSSFGDYQSAQTDFEFEAISL